MKSIKVLFLNIVYLLSCSQGAPVANNEADKAIGYLVKFGYLDDIDNRIADVKVINNAVSEFQRFAGLETTGELDNNTVYLMALPRCGVKDLVGTGDEHRQKRYALQGSKWKVKQLTYKISSYPSMLDKKDVDEEIARALDIWSQNSDLTFERTTGDPRIDIKFAAGEHGDYDAFDGPGGTLAHAFFPTFGGDAHFDSSETWTVKTYRGTNLFQAAAHEFGHSLGLSHSDVRGSLMSPFYRGYDPLFELHDDDVQAIQSLYGTKPLESRFDADDFSEEANSLLCRDFKFDTIFTAANEEVYVFKGQQFWKLAGNGLAPGYPKNISSRWEELPGHIDAAFTYKNGKTYFFKGKQYWRYIGTEMESGYPKSISVGFPGIPNNLDAVLVWSGNGKLYFFKGSKYWRFDSTSKPPIKSIYPKQISIWQGLPNNLDAAFQYGGQSYFFKDGVFWGINDILFAVDTAKPAYPRSTAFWWFGCQSSPNGTILAWA